MRSSSKEKLGASVFVHKEEDNKLLVHEDDSFALADQEGQDCTRKVLAGPGESDDSRLRILNRIVSLDKSTGVVSYEADPRHATATA